MAGPYLTMMLVQAVIVRPLSAVAVLVRFAEEPQMFAIEFNDGCSMHVRQRSMVYELVGCILFLRGSLLSQFHHKHNEQYKLKLSKQV